MPRKYVSVDGVATLLHHRGPTTLPGRPPDTSTGEVVLCLHDAGDNGASFDAVEDALASAYTPIAFDQPGHGRSAGLDSLGSIAAMAAHAKAVADALDLAHPVLLGDGMGVATALEAAIADPDWPRALVLCGGVTARFEVDDQVEQLRRVTTGKARREFDTSGYAPATPKDVYERAFGEWVKTDPRATLGDREAEASWDATGRLDAVRCATLVVIGEHETTRDQAEALAGQLAHARVVELSGAGRRGVIEQPKALAAVITRFLEETRP
ncbi:MAG: alpha/beta fold hydrolase [Acidimicrobiia bacterium]|nr:alpha/beta fold hydrolase [Acidimicrobiia bacterium]